MRKLLLLISILTLGSCSLVKKSFATRVNTNSEVRAYVSKYAPIAQNEMREFGIPASITLAQGILESGAGKSTLARESNNHFGIKCHDWTGPSVLHDDDEENECFRKYSNAAESYRDHSLFLTERNRYVFLFNYRPKDYKAWAKGLKKAGYATDRKYAKRLIAYIKAYDLKQYDRQRYRKKQRVYEFPKLPMGPVQNTSDQSRIHIVQKGETLYYLSKKYQVSIEDLKKWNALKGNHISVGQKIKIK
jgi:flagellum-specific peptidoglycan hydrolase FlgJ